jgi:hypothetical protein
MPVITTESEAVAALEAAVPLGSWPHMVSAETDPIIRADRWLAWLVRQGVVVRWGEQGHVANYFNLFVEHYSPFVAAARAFLENSNG